MAGHVYGWLIFNPVCKQKPLARSKGPHTIKHVRMNKTKKKRGRPRKDPAAKVKSYYVYLKPDQAQGLKQQHGSLTRAIKTVINAAH